VLFRLAGVDELKLRLLSAARAVWKRERVVRRRRIRFRERVGNFGTSILAWAFGLG